MTDRKIALVTGASKGIGAAIAISLAKDGFDIWLNYRSDHEKASEIAETIHDNGAKCILIPFDVSDINSASKALDPYLEKEVPYALINNAGFSKDTLLVWMKQEEWKDVLSVTLDGFFNVTKLVLNYMLRKKQGRIINIASTSGQSGMPGQVNYSAAKSGLIGASKALALEIGKRNILVNVVSPGFIDTEMTKDFLKERVLMMIPMGRFGKDYEVAQTVSFLCSDKASYITGQVINVNGGAYM
ncbi:MAG: 3-oxoacyl-ACP reductase FabG [Desulfobacterales bacterium]|nr:3-oxoacyl-ACP reductase FabG [Desulfobacterales bacterium]MBF0395552.1 3-oxoacyl-ACP reductase FabG [Desulfobacterales bacterium]